MSNAPILRQVLFFAVAVLAPGVMLLLAGMALSEKEGELTVRREADFRTFASRQMADSLLTVLEETYREGPEPESRYRNGVLFATPGWTPPGLSPSFREFLRNTEQEELRQGQNASVSQYQRRLAVVKDSLESGLLVLRMARATEERPWDLRLLDLPLGVTDEFGLPLSYYGARRMLNRGDTTAVRERVRADLRAPRWMNREAVTFAEELLRPDRPSEIDLRLEELVLEAQLLSLPPRPPSSPAWQPDGSGRWLMRMPETDDSLGAAISLATVSELLASRTIAVRIGSPDDEDERSLAPVFPYLTATLDPSLLPRSGSQNRFFLAGLFTVFGLTLFGGYLLWRDVRRETRLSRLRARFVSSVSHELRTPLTSIRLFAETMAMDGSPNESERQKGLMTIAHESERLTRMLNNVMSASRIEQGSEGYRRSPVDLSAVTNSASDAMAYEYQKEGVELDVRTASVEAHVDRDAMEQAVLNLLSNALKYGKDGGRVELKCFQSNGDARVSVRDFGSGITDKDRESIFERYYRSETVAAAGVTGAGLGLSLVRHIVEGHEGSVELDTEPGAGSTFTLVIPLK